jgi:hypothetical protein
MIIADHNNNNNNNNGNDVVDDGSLNAFGGVTEFLEPRRQPSTQKILSDSPKACG